MITLYQMPPAGGLPNLSPFCFKIENYLRMIGEPFEVEIASPQKAPKGKLPFIKDGDVVVSDSAHIVAHLKKTRGDKLDKDLSAADRALGHSLRRMLEEGTYFCLVYGSWIDDAGWALTKKDLFREMPAPMRVFLPGIVRRMVTKQARAQGTGRHTRDEIHAMTSADVGAVAALMGERPYCLGDSPTSTDATAYAFLALMLWGPVPSFAGLVQEHANLVAYCERMKARYYP